MLHYPAIVTARFMCIGSLTIKIRLSPSRAATTIALVGRGLGTGFQDLQDFSLKAGKFLRFLLTHEFLDHPRNQSGMNLVNLEILSTQRLRISVRHVTPNSFLCRLFILFLPIRIIRVHPWPNLIANCSAGDRESLAEKLATDKH
jgi:hypothetical protein